MKNTRNSRSLNYSLNNIVYGVGINDADYFIKINNIICPYYDRWHGMLRRCYCEKWLNKHPSYKGCSVSKEWLKFSNFKEWMEKQDWEGKQLDKDLLIPRNKIYSKNRCVFITQELNKFIKNEHSKKSGYPIGVTSHGDKFQSRCSYFGKRKYLGTFNNVNLAFIAYVKFKSSIYDEVIKHETNNKLTNALKKHKDILINSMEINNA